ncbi:MAG: hypothetical protein EXS15_03025 [Phycisphaerales bacterium]|nr:hypothetical protein [Phycisphaerales bacterium]
MSSSEWWRWFFGVDVIPGGADGLQLSWQHPLALWGWFLVLVGVVIVVVWSYRSVVGGRFSRVLLATVRATLLLLVTALIAGPLLRLPIIESQPDWVAVLVDRSSSMTVADDTSATDSAVSRDDAVRRLLTHNVWSTIQQEREIIWLGFHVSAFDLDPTQPTTADGWGTDLTVPLDTALRRLAGRPASGLVVISDGRTTRPIDHGVLRALQARAVPVFVVPMGSAEAMTDIGITRAEAPSRAFIRDQVPVVATLQCSGGPPKAPVRVELVDEESGRLLQSIDVAPEDFAGGRGEAVLTGARTKAGGARWVVRIHAGPEDLVRANNEVAVDVDFIDRPLRILYIEGYPRWEFRYLKNLLVRESSFESSVMLLSADRDFAQEGNAPLERLPQTQEEFSLYDLFIIGDVPAGSLSHTQISYLRQSISERGAGLLWIAGERSTPGSWRGTELEDLSPIRGVPERFDEAVVVEPTDGALRAGVMRLGETSGERWPIALARSSGRGRLEWSQRIELDSLKPTAEVLARAQPVSGGQALPLVISMRFGAGLVVYVGTDETWRWRHGIGETYQERFWIQFIRYLSRGAAQSDGKAFRLVIEPKQPEVGSQVLIRVDIQDPQAGNLAGADPLDVQLEPIGQSSHVPSQSIQLSGSSGGSSGGSSTGWIGSWSPESAGLWRVRVDSSRTGLMEQGVQVVRSDTEMTHPESDHGQLKDLATRTGGAVLAPAEIGRLTQLLPKRSVSTERAVVDPIWNSPAAFSTVLLLLLIEWIGRRWMRLA